MVHVRRARGTRLVAADHAACAPSPDRDVERRRDRAGGLPRGGGGRHPRADDARRDNPRRRHRAHSCAVVGHDVVLGLSRGRDRRRVDVPARARLARSVRRSRGDPTRRRARDRAPRLLHGRVRLRQGVVAAVGGAVSCRSPAWVDHVRHGLVPIDSPVSLAVHPTELYEAMLGVAIVAIPFIARRARRDGDLFLAAAATYAVGDSRSSSCAATPSAASIMESRAARSSVCVCSGRSSLRAWFAGAVDSAHDADDDGHAAHARLDRRSSGARDKPRRDRVAAAGSQPRAHNLRRRDPARAPARTRARRHRHPARRSRRDADVEPRRAPRGVLRHPARRWRVAHAELAVAARRHRVHRERRVRSHGDRRRRVLLPLSRKSRPPARSSSA